VLKLELTELVIPLALKTDLKFDKNDEPAVDAAVEAASLAAPDIPFDRMFVRTFPPT
jgi:hypothetical protein